MPILSSEHLFEQGRELITPVGAGKPRQVALRRSISTAYYGLFHGACTAAADWWVGYVHRRTDRYALVYRSVGHSGLRKLCEAATSRTLPPKLARYAGTQVFDIHLRAYSEAALSLQDRRHTADYDPAVRFRYADADGALRMAEAALASLGQAPQAERQAFLDLLVFTPR